MAKKHLGQGVVSTASTETTIYSPTSSSSIGVISTLVFHNTSTTLQGTVTIYGPHVGVAGTDDVVKIITINPQKSYICKELINAVCDSSKIISCAVDQANIINFNCSGDETS